jgi:hypothetical protein
VAGNSVAIIGGYVVPIEGPPIPGGTVLVADGKLVPGKDADLVIWSGDPLDIMSRAEVAYIAGREIYRYDYASRSGLLAIP